MTTYGAPVDALVIDLPTSEGGATISIEWEGRDTGEWIISLPPGLLRVHNGRILADHGCAYDIAGDPELRIAGPDEGEL